MILIKPCASGIERLRELSMNDHTIHNFYVQYQHGFMAEVDALAGMVLNLSSRLETMTNILQKQPMPPIVSQCDGRCVFFNEGIK